MLHRRRARKRDEHNARLEKERQAADARRKEEREAVATLKADARSALHNVYRKTYRDGNRTEKEAIDDVLGREVGYNVNFDGITFTLVRTFVQSNRLVSNRDRQDAHLLGDYELDPGVAVVVQRGKHKALLAERAHNSTDSRWL